MSKVSEKMQFYADSEVGKSIQTLMAYTIRKTKTLKDDEIIDNIDDVKEVISQVIDRLADVSPTDKEAKAAALVVLTAVAEATPTKWDDRIIPIVKMFL